MSGDFPIHDLVTRFLNQTAPDAKAVRNSDSSHYYSHTAERGWFPLYSPDKNYTLREARKDQAAGKVAVPSVTTYFKVLHKQQLLNWKTEQAASAMWDIYNGTSDVEVMRRYAKEELIEMALSSTERASRPAADLGTRIHAAIEEAIADRPYDAAMDVYVQGALKARADLGVISEGVEVCCGSLEHGYGGKCDEFAAGMTVVDIKSRKSTGKTPKVASYSTDKMQLAAYGFARWGWDFFEDGRGIIIGISTSNPGVVTPHVFTGQELEAAFDAFIGLMSVWRYENGYEPRLAVTKNTT